jgi:hypothetical protein
MSLVLESENYRSVSLFVSELLKIQQSVIYFESDIRSEFSGPEHFFYDYKIVEKFCNFSLRKREKKVFSISFLLILQTNKSWYRRAPLATIEILLQTAVL